MTNTRTDESKLIEQRSLLKSSCDLEYLLMGDIRALLGEEFDSQTRSSMLVLLDRLILNLPNLLELSSQDGYLSTVLEKRPSWSRQIDALYQANLDCVSSLTSVRNCLEIDRSIAAFSQEFEQRLQNWIVSYSAMRRLEARCCKKLLQLILAVKRELATTVWMERVIRSQKRVIDLLVKRENGIVELY